MPIACARATRAYQIARVSTRKLQTENNATFSLLIRMIFCPTGLQIFFLVQTNEYEEQ